MERKEGPRGQRRGKDVAAGRGASVERKVKVVDLTLPAEKRRRESGEAKPGSKLAGAQKSPVRRGANADQAELKPVSKFRAHAAVARGKSRSVSRPERKIKEERSLVGKPVTSPAELAAYLVSPPREVLRSFRKAAAENRKRVRALERAKSEGAGFLAKPVKTGKRYTVDLRVHSPATNGYFSTGGVDPGPALVRLAKVKGIDIIGLTDYYNATFVDTVKELAARSNVTVIPGLDLRCQIGDCREVYFTALFPENTTSADLFRVLDELQVPIEARGSRDYCLTLPCGEVIAIIERNAGVIIPSRLDKTPYRQLAIPTLVEKFGFHTFDLVHPEHTEFFRDRWPNGEFTFLTFSNANALAQIGSRIAKIRLSAPSFEGIRELVGRRVPAVSKAVPRGSLPPR